MSVRSVAMLLTSPARSNDFELRLSETLACLSTFCITNPKWPKLTKHCRFFAPKLLHCHRISRLQHSNAQEGDDNCPALGTLQQVCHCSGIFQLNFQLSQTQAWRFLGHGLEKAITLEVSLTCTLETIHGSDNLAPCTCSSG